MTYVYDSNNPFSLTATNTIGRLVAVWTGSNPQFNAWTAFSYDSMGRPITQWNCASFPWASTCPNIQTTSVAYDQTGNPTQIVYPSGLTVQQSFDTSGRVCQVAPSTNSCTAAASYWAANLTYDPISQLTGMTYGNGVSATYGYSNRLQEASIKYAKGASTLFSQTYAFGTGTNNNGQVTGVTDLVDNGRSATYTYDPLNRLATASTTGSANYAAWGLSWTYDQYGNRTAQTQTAGNPPQNSVSVDPSTNHINTPNQGYSYDASGNITGDGNNVLTYDAEGRVLTATNGGGSGSYNYSGDSVRVHQVSTTASGTTTSNSVYLGPNLIGQYDNESGALGENIYLGGQRIAAVGGVSVTNGGFESGSSGWTLTSGASIVTSANAHSGSSYLQISTTGSATAHSATFAVHPGDQIDFGGWVYLESGTAAAVDWVLATLDSSHNLLATVVPTPWSVTTAGAWTYETGSYQVASNVAYVYFYANVYQSSGTTTVRFDDGFAIFGTRYFHTDQLSTRVVTDATGSVIGQQGHYPFGELWYPISGNPTTNWQFTSYQRDTESLNDYAMARSYVNRLARFSSPDPVGLNAASLSDPQTLNAYAYVRNSPQSWTDPFGLAPSCKSSSPCERASGVPSGGGGFAWFPDMNVGGCTLDGTFFPCEWANGLLQSLTGSVKQCPNNDCSSITGFDENGFYKTVRDYMVLLCNGHDIDNYYCSMAPAGRQYLQPLDPEQMYFSSDDARLRYIGQGVVSGAGGIGDPRFIAGFYAASALLAVPEAIATDFARGPWESTLFGRNGGFLNSADGLRVGFGWYGEIGQNVFRVTGEWLNGEHYLNWPWP